MVMLTMKAHQENNSLILSLTKDGLVGLQTMNPR